MGRLQMPKSISIGYETPGREAKHRGEIQPLGKTQDRKGPGEEPDLLSLQPTKHMGNISSLLPAIPATTQAIYDYWKAKGGSEKPRSYLGMSSIGHECERALWYGFRHSTREEFDGRLYRLFNRGHREETVFAEELEGIGCTVHLTDEEGNQFGFSDFGGHFKGHMDAAILGVLEAPKTWHLGEFKTHSDKSFKDLVKLGVQASKPVHYAQMQIYMYYGSMIRALYVAVNKDTDEIYTERAWYDAKFANAIRAKAGRIIASPQPPERITERRDDFRCRFCSARSLCHGSVAPEPAVPLPALSCRQCVHATPETDSDHGRWSCAKHGKTLSRHAQDNPCGDLLLIPGLITFAEPINAHKTPSGQDVIEFKNLTDGAIWYHGPDSDAGHYTAKDLMVLPVDLIGGDEVKQRITPAADSTVIEPDLRLKYTHEDIEIVYTGSTDRLAETWSQMFPGLDITTPIRTQSGDDWQAAEYPGEILITVAGEWADIRINGHPDNDAYQYFFPTTNNQ